MPEIIERKNPFAIPEPYFLPGYTGHCPNVSKVVGQTFGRATHSAMTEGPPARALLKPLCRPQPQVEEEVNILEQRKPLEGKPLLSKNISPGYGGHVPRASYLVGLRFNESCIKGVAEFEKNKKKYEDMLRVSEDSQTPAPKDPCSANSE